jgi:FMN phosphatase YigB (HAD superfamily)
MTQPKAFLFDIGNVLTRFDFAPVAAGLTAGSTTAPADPLGELLEIKDQLERGDLDEDAFVNRATRRLGFRGDSETFLALWCDIFTEIEPMSRLVEALHEAGYPLYLLSNTSAPHLRHLQATFPVFAFFRGGTYSHEARSMKPDEGIFRTAIEYFALVPNETLYIDDLAANIETGKRLGFLTHHYDPDRHHEFAALLGDLGIAVVAEN